MNAQVFTTRTSASSASEVICIPRASTLPSMISASTRFLAQPRLIMPTVVRPAAGEVLFKSDIGIARHEGRSVFHDLHRSTLEQLHPQSPPTERERRIRWVEPAVKGR